MAMFTGDVQQLADCLNELLIGSDYSPDRFVVDMRALGISEDDALQLANYVLELENIALEAVSSPEPSNEDDWNTISTNISGIFNSKYNLEFSVEDDCGIYFPLEQWEERLADRKAGE